MIDATWLIALAVFLGSPADTPSGTNVHPGTSSAYIVTLPEATPVEVDVDRTVVGFVLSDKKCAIVFDGRLAVFRTAPGAPARRFFKGTPFVRHAKLLGSSCAVTLRLQ